MKLQHTDAIALEFEKLLQMYEPLKAEKSKVIVGNSENDELNWEEMPRQATAETSRILEPEKSQEEAKETVREPQRTAEPGQLGISVAPKRFYRSFWRSLVRRALRQARHYDIQVVTQEDRTLV